MPAPWPRPLLLAAVLLSGGPAGRGSAAPASPPPPHDPNAPLPPDPPADPYEAAPPMPAPYAQPRAEAGRRLAGGLAVDSAARRRVSLSAVPAYAAAVVAMHGRDAIVHHGGGIGAALDVPLLRYLWLRLFGQVSAHPLREAVERADDTVKVVAPSGTMTIAGGTAGIAYGLDFSRISAIVDLGIGPIAIRTPAGVRDGQRGMPCAAGGGCDPGLVCSQAGVCTPRLAPVAAAGLAAEWLVRRHLSLGIAVRYYAFLANVSAFPVYLLAGATFGIRF